ncbi:ELMO/CED-12 family-domain-containing protein [Phyllosticta capitalensis]|uniref:ELMO/CED-12 family-domain-containing protein n=1 Tax=Phyllosticta capitalensis TaxID=121624 RepID=UPI00312D54C7
MENVDISDLVERLGSDDDSGRKMAAFKLQSVIGDPSFADVFEAEGGLPKLRYLCLHAHGNTLAYALTSFSRLLELDKGWDFVNQDLIERLTAVAASQTVELVVSQPLVNILRGAMSILVAIVSHPYYRAAPPGNFGFRALKPAVAIYPQFLEMLVARLSSADHALCANALQLINSLMRDAITNDSENEWHKFIKKLQDLGVISATYVLMQGTALQDLAHPLFEFQTLSKVLLRKWRDVKVELEKSEHRRALKGLHLASKPERLMSTKSREGGSRRHHPEKWRRLGFESESPGWEFEHTGYLGLMDLSDFVRTHEDAFQKLLLEQSNQPQEQRCPIARASLAVSTILYDHFEVDKSDHDDRERYAILESRTNFDRAFRPLILQWSRLHTSGLQAFLRLWQATGAEVEDFEKVEELVRILIEQVVGQAPRQKELQEVEDEIAEFDYQKLRELQMQLLELTYEEAWGQHLRQVREELNHEALQFVKEQRIRCLLAGAWFPHTLSYKEDTGPITKEQLNRTHPTSWRYARLSHNRRFLHYADFEQKTEHGPRLDQLSNKIDLSTISSVVSNVSASAPSTASSASTLRDLPNTTSTKITVYGYPPPADTQHRTHSPNPKPSSSKHHAEPSSAAASTHNGTTHQHHHAANGSVSGTTTTTATGVSGTGAGGAVKESVLLQLHPPTHVAASEWLDGLLMLLNQQPITADTHKLVQAVGGYGLKIRLLNVRLEDLPPGGVVVGGDGAGEVGVAKTAVELPSREGLDEDYWYDVGGMDGP